MKIPFFIVVLFLNSIWCSVNIQHLNPTNKYHGPFFFPQEGLVRLATERYSLSPHSFGILGMCGLTNGLEAPKMGLWSLGVPKRL